MPRSENRDEVHYPRVAQQVVADSRELTVDDLRIEAAELARDLGLGLPHALLEGCVPFSHRDDES